MINLKDTHPWIYKCSKKKGYPTMQHSDWYWAGLWINLMTEKVIMCSLKTRGGVMADSVSLGLEVCTRHAGIHEAITTLTNMKRNK